MIMLMSVLSSAVSVFFPCLRPRLLDVSRDPPSTLTTLEDCDRLGERRFLRQDYNIECYKKEWNAFLPIALALLCGFAVLFPVLLAGYLFWHRNDLHTPEIRSKVGWLYSRFRRDSAEWWEAHEVSGRWWCLVSRAPFFPSLCAPEF